ncbi:MAG: hypothetical protein GXO96_09915 [Nitrospirae bacterium]|nr:hypothetical protein [Candidatus Manganitrophaceae bacterium]
MRSLLKNNQQGIAMLITLMVLSLGSSFALLAFQVSTTDLSIARYSEGEAAVQYLAESGVEKVVSWAYTPVDSPDPVFFENLLTNNCSQEKTNADFPNAANLRIAPFPDFPAYLGDPDNGPFAELKDIGKITNIQLYAPTHATKGICTVEVTATTPQGASAKVRVNIATNPMGNITSGIQGRGNAGRIRDTDPVWAHWGKVRYTGQAKLGEDIRIVPQKDPNFLPNSNRYDTDNYEENFDPMMELFVENEIIGPLPDGDDGNSYNDRPNVMQNKGSSVKLDEIDFVQLKSFIRKHGEYYTVSEDGQHLLKNGQHILDQNGDHVDSFDAIFHERTDKHQLVWIENAGAPRLQIEKGRFKGYFYFSGGVYIEGRVSGRRTNGVSPPVGGYPDGVPLELSHINLEGLFFVQDTVYLQDYFRIYGAFYSLGGFMGTGSFQLQVWYNSSYARGIYPGVRNITPLAGTWQSIPLDG